MTRAARTAHTLRRSVRAVVLALVIAALGLGGQAWAVGGDAGHVHAVAFDPGDEALLLGTHEGLFRLAVGGQRARKVGTVSYDLMGLAALGPRSYVASGHPDPAAAAKKGLPANLGLIRTDSGGLRWRFVSLRGSADFHLLRARGTRVLAFDVVGRRMLASTDAGRTWQPRQVPQGAADIALGPGAGAVIASTETGLLVSADGGATYRPRARGVGPGLVAWPSAKRVVVVRGDGRVLTSDDAGRSFDQRAALGDGPSAMAAWGRRVAVVLESGRVLLSVDGGGRFADVRWGGG